MKKKKWIFIIALLIIFISTFFIDGKDLVCWYYIIKAENKIKNNIFDKELSDCLAACHHKLPPDVIARCIKSYDSRGDKIWLIIRSATFNRQDMIPFLKDIANSEKDERVKVYAMATAVAIENNIKLPDFEQDYKERGFLVDTTRMKVFDKYLRAVYSEYQENPTKSVESIAQNVVKSWNAGEYQINDKTAKDTENK